MEFSISMSEKGQGFIDNDFNTIKQCQVTILKVTAILISYFDRSIVSRSYITDRKSH